MKCEIKEGDEVYLIKGGKVLFQSGEVYNLKDCNVSGGKIIIGIEETVPSAQKKKSKFIKKKSKSKKGKVLLEDIEISLGDLKLKNPYVEIKTAVQQKKLEETKPHKEIDVPGNLLPFTIAFSCIFYLFKKISGLDRKLSSESCEVRHIEAINRIAELEGKVLRKQIIDGSKAIKSKVDKKREEKT